MSLKLASSEFRDKIAVTLSMLCILQCLFLPIVVTLLPLMNIWWLSDHVLHPFMLLFVIPLTLLSLIPGYFKHKDLQPLLIAIPALSLLIIGAFMPVTLTEKLLTVAGAGLLAFAHIRNLILNRCTYLLADG